MIDRFDQLDAKKIEALVHCLTLTWGECVVVFDCVLKIREQLKFLLIFSDQLFDRFMRNAYSA